MESSAQSVDSLAMERVIVEVDPSSAFLTNARSLLLRRLRGRDDVGVGALMSFMDHRVDPGAAPWLSSVERLYAEVILARRTTVAAAAFIGDLLRNAHAERDRPTMAPDRLFRSMREMLRTDVAGIAARFDAEAPSNEERRFFNLLVNHLLVTGYRAQAELNDRVEEFARDYPGSPLTPLARAYVSKEYSERDYGASFGAGYGGGTFGGAIADRFRKFHGPMLSGEIYVDEVTVALSVLIGVADAPASFTAGGDVWPAGDASLINLTFDAGYEFRFGRLAVTPLAGLAVQAMRAAEGELLDAEEPRTRNRYGYDLGVMIGYRIPFDLGPHIDLRGRFGRSASALIDYDPGFAGGIYYAELGFALVFRPYLGRVRGEREP